MIRYTRDTWVASRSHHRSPSRSIERPARARNTSASVVKQPAVEATLLCGKQDLLKLSCQGRKRLPLTTQCSCPEAQMQSRQTGFLCTKQYSLVACRKARRGPP